MEKCKDDSMHISKGIANARRCANNAWKDGYCKVHHPDQQKEREKKHWDRWEKKWEAERLGQARVVAGEKFVEARKAAGLLTLKEAKALGAKV